MNRMSTLLRSELVSVVRFDHLEQSAHEDPPGEASSRYAISFVESGEFSVSVGRKHWRLRPGAVIVTRPATEYNYRHFEQCPSDVCLYVEYADAFVERIPPRKGATRSDDTVLPPSNRLAYLQLLFARLVREGVASDSCRMALEVLAGDLFVAVESERRPAKSRLCRPSQLAWYADRVERVRGILEAEYADEHSLVSLGRAVGMSPYHLAHVFRELAGQPPHGYLMHVRLRHACERLRDGASVTDTCFAVGFSNLSYFTRVFHRIFGVPPSRFAQARGATPVCIPRFRSPNA